MIITTEGRRGRCWPRIILLGLASIAGPAAQGAERGNDRFLTRVRQLTFEGRRSGECYFSPDGRQLVFMSEREPENPFFQIYTLDLETGDVKRVSSGRGKTTCPYFQAGTGFIEYASTHLDPDFTEKARQEYQRRAEGAPRRGAWDYDEHYDIFVSRPDGTLVQRLTDARGYDAEGAYSPDGRRVVFCSLRDAYPPERLSPEQQALFEKQPEYFGEIYIMNADGSEQTRLTNWPGYDGGPFFTPDGQRIVWRHFSEDGVLADVYTMKIDGSDLRRLTAFGAMSWAPFFHPSGAYCIFTTNKLGFDNFELYIVDALGEREPVRVTFTDDFDGLAVFSPDGRRLCWTSNHTPGKLSQMFMAEWDHEQALQAISEAPLRGASAETPPSASHRSGAGSGPAAEADPHGGH